MNDINTIINDEFLDSLDIDTDSESYNIYKEHYAGKSFSLEEFINLEKITWADKLFVFWHGEFLTVKQKNEFLLIFSEDISDIFEAVYPEDSIVREALEACINGNITSKIVEEVNHASCRSYNLAFEARCVAYDQLKRDSKNSALGRDVSLLGTTEAFIDFYRRQAADSAASAAYKIADAYAFGYTCTFGVAGHHDIDLDYFFSVYLSDADFYFPADIDDFFHSVVYDAVVNAVDNDDCEDDSYCLILPDIEYFSSGGMVEFEVRKILKKIKDKQF